MLSVKNAAETWLSNLVLMVNSWHAQDSQSAEIQNLSLRRLVYHVQNVAEMWLFASLKREENSLDALITQSVTLLVGQSLQPKSVQNAELTWLKRAINWFVQTMNADLWKIRINSYNILNFIAICSNRCYNWYKFHISSGTTV